MARVVSTGPKKTEHFVIGAIHPVYPNKEPIRRDTDGKGFIELKITTGESLELSDYPSAQSYWSLYEPNGHIMTLLSTGVPNEFHMIQNKPSPSPPLIGATLTPHVSPQKKKIPDVCAVLWADHIILWCVNSKNQSICYIFVDHPDIKPVAWPRDDALFGEGYRRILVPSNLFHTDQTRKYIDTHGHGSAEDLNEYVRYTDHGQHKRRSFWCKLSKDGGKYHAELVVLERPMEPLCPSLTNVESPIGLFSPFAPQKKVCHNNNNGANLSYVESHDVFKNAGL
jgi:hypothetical protein